MFRHRQSRIGRMLGAEFEGRLTAVAVAGAARLVAFALLLAIGVRFLGG